MMSDKPFWNPENINSQLRLVKTIRECQDINELKSLSLALLELVNGLYKALPDKNKEFFRQQ